MLENKAEILDYLRDYPENITKKRQEVYVNISLDAPTLEYLTAKKWDIVDVRLLPTDTIPQRATAVLATLQGARQGTILMNQIQLRQLELEAKICGLLVNKDQGNEAREVEEFSLEKLFDFTPKSKSGRKKKEVIEE